MAFLSFLPHLLQKQSAHIGKKGFPILELAQLALEEGSCTHLGLLMFVSKNFFQPLAKRMVCATTSNVHSKVFLALFPQLFQGLMMLEEFFWEPVKITLSGLIVDLI